MASSVRRASLRGWSRRDNARTAVRLSSAVGLSRNSFRAEPRRPQVVRRERPDSAFCGWARRRGRRGLGHPLRCGAESPPRSPRRRRRAKSRRRSSPPSPRTRKASRSARSRPSSPEHGEIDAAEPDRRFNYEAHNADLSRPTDRNIGPSTESGVENATKIRAVGFRKRQLSGNYVREPETMSDAYRP